MCDPLAPSVLGEVTSNLVLHRLAALAHTASPCSIFFSPFPIFHLSGNFPSFSPSSLRTHLYRTPSTVVEAHL